MELLIKINKYVQNKHTEYKTKAKANEAKTV